MITITKSIMITASSIIEENGQDIVIANMNANISNDGNVSINKSTINKDIFDKHKNQALEDFSQFEKYVYNVADEQ